MGFELFWSKMWHRFRLFVLREIGPGGGGGGEPRTTRSGCSPENLN